MEYRIENIGEKKFIGKRKRMSFLKNTTADLWRSFMPFRNDIPNRVSPDLYSIQIYSPGFFNHFSPEAKFEKWAAADVEDFSTVPEGMERFTLPGGMYAVFLYIGSSSAAASTFRYILGIWMKESEFTLDNRPHFEILGMKYKNEDPASEEEIWIPVIPEA